jgi:hypothetical protein
MMMIMMGHEIKRGIMRGESKGGKKGKEKILRDKED